ncbi:transcription elongation factor GreA [Candidatus Falkowbacteria bacterium]|nr:transcription elongation factor GreA [Candidatus Falkowbacteria bacterium]
MSNPIILTKDGKEKLEKELKELKEVRRPDIIEKIEQAREMGDLSENAEYHEAKDQQGRIESRIAEIEGLFKKAIIADASENKSSIISMSTKFIVEDAGGNKKELTIVGFNEANPQFGMISNESPMAKAFLGKSAGDTVEVSAPKGAMAYKILKII